MDVFDKKKFKKNELNEWNKLIEIYQLKLINWNYTCKYYRDIHAINTINPTGAKN